MMLCTCFFLYSFLLFSCLLVSRVSTQTPSITENFFVSWGNSGSENSFASTIDKSGSGNIYVTGNTDGPLGSPLSAIQAVNAGSNDWFVLKFSSLGALLWMRLLATPQNDYGADVTTDVNGNVYVVGQSYGYLLNFVPVNSNGHSYACKYGPDGTRIWCSNFGATYTGTDAAERVVVNNGVVYVAGRWDANSYDVWFATLDAGTGTLLSTNSIVAPGTEYLTSIALDSNGYGYFTGSTTGNLPQVLGKNSVLVPGFTNAGSSDGFLLVVDSATGLRIATIPIQTSTDDGALSVAVDGLGGVYVSGYTYTSLNGQPYSGSGYNAFVIKYALPSFSVVWTREYSTPSYSAYGVRLVADGLGGLYLAVAAASEDVDINDNTQASYQPGYLYKIDINGNLIWQTSGLPSVQSLTLDSTGVIVSSGPFYSQFEGVATVSYSWDGGLRKSTLNFNCSCSNLQALVTQVQQLLNIAPQF